MLPSSNELSIFSQASICRPDIMNRIPLIVSEIKHNLAHLHLNCGNTSPSAYEDLLHGLMALMVEQQAEIFLLKSKLEKVEKKINSRKRYRRRVVPNTVITSDIPVITSDITDITAYTNNTTDTSFIAYDTNNTSNNPAITSDIPVITYEDPIINTELNSNDINEYPPSKDIITNISQESVPSAQPPMFFAPSPSGINAISSRSRSIRPRYKAVNYEDIREKERKLQEAAIKQNGSNGSGMLSNVLGMFGKKTHTTIKFTADELAAQVAAGILKPTDALDASKPPPIVTHNY